MRFGCHGGPTDGSIERDSVPLYACPCCAVLSLADPSAVLWCEYCEGPVPALVIATGDATVAAAAKNTIPLAPTVRQAIQDLDLGEDRLPVGLISVDAHDGGNNHTTKLLWLKDQTAKQCGEAVAAIVGVCTVRHQCDPAPIGSLDPLNVPKLLHTNQPPKLQTEMCLSRVCTAYCVLK